MKRLLKQLFQKSLVYKTSLLKFYFYGLLAFAGSFLFHAHGVTQESILEMSTHPQWLKLLRYQKNFLGDYHSQADDPNFFLSNEGKSSPFKELKSFVEAYERGDKKLCRFFARQDFVKRNLNLKERIKKSDCPEYMKFRDGLKRVEKAYLVFSSYHLESPASAFGHTFLRLGTSGNNQLLDYGVNYAANVTTKNALLYAALGITGGFTGNFTTLPYFYKIREYNDHESRDIWSYEVKLSDSDLDLLIDHLWEMGSNYFDYFYFDENCSYHILALLDAILYREDLIKEVSNFVVPIDTVKILKRKNLIKKGENRISARKKFLHHWDQLKDDEKSSVISNIESNYRSVAKEGVNKESQAKVLETTISHLDYKKSSEILLEDKEWTGVRRKLLIKRAKLGRQKTFDDISDDEVDPILSHDSMMFRLSYIDADVDFYKMTLRTTLHDSIDYPAGQKEFSGLTMGTFSLSYREENLEIDEVNIYDILSLSPVNELELPLSFSSSLGQKKINIDSCFYCSTYSFEGFGGLSFSYENIVFYFLSGLKSLYLDKTDNRLRLWAGIKVGTLFQSEMFSLRVESTRVIREIESMPDFFHHQAQLSIHSRNQFFRGGYQYFNNEHSLELSLGTHF